MSTKTKNKCLFSDAWLSHSRFSEWLKRAAINGKHIAVLLKDPASKESQKKSKNSGKYFSAC